MSTFSFDLNAISFSNKLFADSHLPSSLEDFLPKSYGFSFLFSIRVERFFINQSCRFSSLVLDWDEEVFH